MSSVELRPTHVLVWVTLSFNCTWNPPSYRDFPLWQKYETESVVVVIPLHGRGTGTMLSTRTSSAHSSHFIHILYVKAISSTFPLLSLLLPFPLLRLPWLQLRDFPL